MSNSIYLLNQVLSADVAVVFAVFLGRMFFSPRYIVKLCQFLIRLRQCSGVMLRSGEQFVTVPTERLNIFHRKWWCPLLIATVYDVVVVVVTVLRQLDIYADEKKHNQFLYTLKGTTPTHTALFNSVSYALLQAVLCIWYQQTHNPRQVHRQVVLHENFDYPITIQTIRW